MSSIIDLWRNDRTSLSEKKLLQILSFAGEGKLRDDNETSREFREYLASIPNDRLIGHARECLEESFPDSGLALQDVVNEIGSRLQFDVTHGRYRGTSNTIGFDGIWQANDGHSLVIEVKTTDTYRINLDTLNQYRKALASKDVLSFDRSSVLIVVGRHDTGDLEAQIRGSRLAWSIRLVSVDSLLSLLSLREKLSDSRTMHQVSQVLRPMEYTRIDTLIDLMFTTARDVEIDDVSQDDLESTPSNTTAQNSDESNQNSRSAPVSFHQDCADRMEQTLSAPLIKESRSGYRSSDGTIGIVLSISKPHQTGTHTRYWFSFHPHQEEFLKPFNTAYLALGCGSSDVLFLIPIEDFLAIRPRLGTTERPDKIYWHIVIYARPDGDYELRVPDGPDFISLARYLV
jgi:hypothetical protein